jgi:hypothetical protein
MSNAISCKIATSPLEATSVCVAINQCQLTHPPFVGWSACADKALHIITVVSFVHDVGTSFMRRLMHAFPSSSLNCFPDNCVWPDLTAKEHLELFAD